MIAAVAVLAWAWLLFCHGRFWHSGPELAPARPRRFPSVAVIVPARDEAETIAASITSLLAQQYDGPLRVTLVDDASSDATAAIAAGLPDPAGRLTILHAPPRPEGWAGKLWAVSRGVAASEGELLLLTDADIAHDPRHVATLVAKLDASGADMVSEMVRLRCQSLAERALVPAFVYFFQLLYPFAWVNDTQRATAAAAGGTVLIRAPALARIGGIAAIRGALIDDCALAARVKRGGRVWLGHSGLARSLRPYPGAGDIWRMIARSAYVQLGRSPVMLLACVAGLALLFLAPPLYALAGAGWRQWAGGLAWAAMALSLVPTLARYRQSRAWGVALPAIAGFYIAATLASALDHHLGRGVRWKARAYET